jgi:hypothetical protein
MFAQLVAWLWFEKIIPASDARQSTRPMRIPQNNITSTHKRVLKSKGQRATCSSAEISA